MKIYSCLLMKSLVHNTKSDMLTPVECIIILVAQRQDHFEDVPHFHLNSLWPSDTICRQRSGSTLAQAMACCLTAPSHSLNQCWLIISEIFWHSQWVHKLLFCIMSLKIILLKYLKHLPGANELMATCTPIQGYLSVMTMICPITQFLVGSCMRYCCTVAFW